jgi:hypothetical protein
MGEMDCSVNDYIDDTWFSASDTNGINSIKWVLIFLKIPSFQKMESFIEVNISAFKKDTLILSKI